MDKKMNSPALDTEKARTAPKDEDLHDGTVLNGLDVIFEAHGLKLLAIDAMIVCVNDV